MSLFDYQYSLSTRARCYDSGHLPTEVMSLKFTMKSRNGMLSEFEIAGTTCARCGKTYQVR